VNPRVLIAMVLVSVFALGAIVLAANGREESQSAGPRHFEGSILPEGLRAPDFALKNQQGKRITMRRLRGRPVIVTFLYTTCDNTCPTQAQTAKGALDDLGRDYPVVAIAVDPPRDNADRARRFLSKVGMIGRMDFVLGSRAQLRPLWRGYAIRPQRKRLEHQGRFVLVDTRGRQRVAFPIDQATPERLAHDVRILAHGD
jgi:protein SCO1/2